MFFFVVFLMFMGLYLFNLISRGWDMSFNKVFGVKFSNVGLIKGFDGLFSFLVEFCGVLNSFI